MLDLKRSEITLTQGQPMAARNTIVQRAPAIPGPEAPSESAQAAAAQAAAPSAGNQQPPVNPEVIARRVYELMRKDLSSLTAGEEFNMAYSRGPDPSPSFKFHVEIQGVEVARFSECSGIEFETETFDYKEGGLNSRLHRFPGRWKFTNLTLKKGISTDGKTLWDWVENVIKNANTGQFETHSVTVTLYNVKGDSPVRTWTYQDAYPVKWSATALTAEQNAIAIETLALAHQGLDFAQ